jgi:hypothetical protein
LPPCSATDCATWAGKRRRAQNALDFPRRPHFIQPGRLKGRARAGTVAVWRQIIMGLGPMKLASTLILLSVASQAVMIFLMISGASPLYLNLWVLLSIVLMVIVRSIIVKWKLNFVDVFRLRGNIGIYKDEWRVMIIYVPTFLAIVSLLNKTYEGSDQISPLLIATLFVLVGVSLREFFIRIKF